MTDIIFYYDGYAFGWVVICVDAEGNQIWEAQYSANRKNLKKEWTI